MTTKMPEAEKFCLRWNDFETNISKAFRELRADKDFFDVTLACEEGKQIQAHKVVLSACSSFFRGVLRNNPHQHPLLYLKDVKFDDVRAILNFMYHGEVNVIQDQLNSFLLVAEDLKVKGLTQMPLTENAEVKPATAVAASSAGDGAPAATSTRELAQPARSATVKRPLSSDTGSSSSPSISSKEGPSGVKAPKLPKLTKMTPMDCGGESNPTRERFSEDLSEPLQPGGSDLSSVIVPEPATANVKMEASPLVEIDAETAQVEEYVDDPGFEYDESFGDQDYETTSGVVQTNLSGMSPSDFLAANSKKIPRLGYECLVCNKRTRDLWGMRRHMEGRHLMTASYRCNLCNFSCTSLNAIQRHGKHQHPESRHLNTMPSMS